MMGIHFYPRIRWLTGVCVLALFVADRLNAAEQPANPDEATLRTAKTGTSVEALLQFFSERTNAREQTGTIDGLIRKPASDSVDERERASGKLAAMDLAARPALLKAMNDPDLEVKLRARHCLEQIEWQRRASLMLAATRRLLARHPAGTIETLLRYLPYAQDDEVEEEISFGIDRLTVSTGKRDPALLTALKDVAPARRALAACIVGRIGNPEQRAAVKKLLSDDNATVRLRAAQGLLVGKDKAAIPVLIALLDQPSAVLAWQAEELLHYIAGQDSPAATIGSAAPALRRKCREAWERWWRTNEQKLDLTKEDPDQRRPGLILVWDEGASHEKPEGQVWLYGCDGTSRWQLSGLAQPEELFLIPGGRLLVIETVVEGGKLKEQTRRVTERNLEGKVLWEWRPPEGESLRWVRRISSGNTLVVSYPSNGGPWIVRELAPDGREALRREYDGLGGRSWLAGSGRLVSEWYESLKEDKGIWQLDLTTGATTKLMNPVLKNIVGGARIWHVEPLAEGHVLLAHGKGVTEIDDSGRTVWKSALPLEERRTVYATRLRNGNTLVLAPCGFFIEETRGGKLVWELPARGGMTHDCLSLVRLGFDGSRPTDWRVDSVSSRMHQLRNKDPRVRDRAAHELVRLGPIAAEAIPALLDAYDDADPKVNMPSIIGMGPTAIPRLIQALKDPRPRVRAAAVICLGRVQADQERYVSAVIDALNDESGVVRNAAFLILGEHGPKAKPAVPVLIKLLQDENPEVAASAAEVLGKIGPDAREAVPALVKTLNHKRRAAAASAAEALGMIGADAREAVPTLIDAAKILPDGPEDKLRGCALGALGRIGTSAKGAVPFLAGIVNNKDYAPHRRTIVSALVAIGVATDPVLSALVEGLKNKDYRGDRAKFAYALGRFGTAATVAVPALAAALKSEDDELRREAATALGKIGPAAKKAVPSLIEALKVRKRIPAIDEARINERVRIAVVVALGEIGPDARDALPALQEASKEKRWRLRGVTDVFAGSEEDQSRADETFPIVVDPKFQPAIRAALEKIEGRR
jgi:HEAT repeat protein